LRERLHALLDSRRTPRIAALAAALLALPSLFFGLHVDDLLQRCIALGCPVGPTSTLPWWKLFTFLDGDAAHTRALADLGVLPWWTDDGVRLSFFRPLAAATHALDYALFPRSPALMHAESIAMYAALCALAAVLYRRVVGEGRVASVAALLFAIDDTHGMPVGWVANRNALLGVGLGLAAITLHDRARRDGFRPGYVLGPIAFAAGLLAGEAAVATLAYLAAHALFLDDAPAPRRAAALAPYAVVLVVWQLGYRALGFGALHSVFYIDPGTSPAAFALAVLERGPVLLFGLLGPIPIDGWTLLPRAGQLALSLLGLVTALAFARLAWRQLATTPSARFFAAGTLLAIVPVSATFPMARLLLFASFGALGLVAAVLADLAASPPTRARRAARLALVGTHAIAAPLAFPLGLLAPVALGHFDERAIASLPADDAVRARTVVMVATPGPYAPMLLPFLRGVDGVPVPARTLRLANGWAPLALTRLDDRTLEVAAEAGTLAEKEGFMVRSPARGLVAGDRVEHPAATIEVLAAANGLPTRARFRFRVALDAPELAFVAWGRDALFQAWRPPAVGETVRFAAIPPLPE
jgi:hypothetical protein